MPDWGMFERFVTCMVRVIVPLVPRDVGVADKSTARDFLVHVELLAGATILVQLAEFDAPEPAASESV